MPEFVSNIDNSWDHEPVPVLFLSAIEVHRARMEVLDDLIARTEAEMQAIAVDQRETKQGIERLRIGIFQTKKLTQLISTLLKELKLRVNNPDIYEAVLDLIRTLNIEMEIFESNLAEINIPPGESAENFIQACKAAIEKTQPIIEKDLRLAEILFNMLVVVANKVITMVSPGSTNHFFTPIRPPLAIVLEQNAKEFLMLPNSV